MSYSPLDILNYVFESSQDQAFLLALMNHKQGYSIGEIPDKKLLLRNGKVRLVSQAYNINVDLDDEQVLTAVMNGLYVSAFASRKGDAFHVHFLCHQYPESMKAKFEEEIAMDVVRYMIGNTIVALRLDTPKKVDDYVNR